MENYFKKYLDNYKRVLDSISPADVNNLFGQISQTIQSGNQILVFGNGGSAMSMSHFATDMVKGAGDALEKRVKVISLNDNAGLITAIGNDYTFTDVFYKQLKTLANPGDLVLTLSVSGSSPNLVKAFEWARTNNIKTIAMVGGRKGKLSEIADTTLVIDSLHYGYVEDTHMLICHMIAFGFMENPVVLD
ncbi:SIS domain-containing protein [Flavobacteriaceae bacterium F89]|uniref:SIS domain-containing protein n=1 Tax=Cerina litoralis TaxID=2874477 RepID=A0AAE3JQ92_9FLAO|nr:SIS domain-containing protein [Cerina litoralis]MCG2461609.1 SIS domain-containing protein [Cerina litoralis]